MSISPFNSELNSIIPPEIKDDEFYTIIQDLAKSANIKTILEIGSSSGTGSTEAFVIGLRQNENLPQLYCMEVSQNRFKNLKDRYTDDTFVHCYNMSSVSVAAFPNESIVSDFYHNGNNTLVGYPLSTVLGWLRQDINYIQKSEVPVDGIKKIKEENKIDYFDIVLIDGSEFTGSAELDEIYGSKFILLDDITTFKNYKNHARLLADPNYSLVCQNKSIRNGYSVFREINKTSLKVENCNSSKVVDGNAVEIKGRHSGNKEIGIANDDDDINLSLPINFFTIILNGMPYVQYHINIFKQLKIEWHWHIIEGVADLNHDTGWSIQNGGKISDNFHRDGFSIDGTTEYLDDLKLLYPDNITIHRKPKDIFWDGKREMVNQPLLHINRECLLWQIDADELWTLKQVETVHQLFSANPAKMAAFYWCWYFVGEDKVISTRNCYAQNPQQEWLRTWRYTPGCMWIAHEPPQLYRPSGNGEWQDVASINSFTHDETENAGLVFQHFAYATKEQLAFKESYYGYSYAIESWEKLQETKKFPVLLSSYFDWVGDLTEVNLARSMGVEPICQKSVQSNSWIFLGSEEFNRKTKSLNSFRSKIVIDGVFFQLYSTGIARVWRSLLEEWVKTKFSDYIVLLDRAGTAPQITGVTYYQIPAYDYDDTDNDRLMLQEVCEELGAELFLSTYYTTPTETPSIFVGHDMIPEILGADLSLPMWREKHYAIEHAISYIVVSESTKNDLSRICNIEPEKIVVAHNGVSDIFRPSSAVDGIAFRHKYGIINPYFIIGSTHGYKNIGLFIEAFALLPLKTGIDIVCTGGNVLSDEMRSKLLSTRIHYLQLSDQELSVAYSQALALVYPSRYEGFGMPILEAMACHCPVITCANSSLTEVGGESPIYVDENNILEMAQALCNIMKPNVRINAIEAGIYQAHHFSWEKMANLIELEIMKATSARFSLRSENLIVFPNWNRGNELGVELKNIFFLLSKHFTGTLLIDIGLDTEHSDALEFVFGILIALALEDDINIEECFAITILDDLAPIQWSYLKANITNKINLASEDTERIAKVNYSTIASYVFPE
jgi:glycosyltransferase involved in cell wall biosynthesis